MSCDVWVLRFILHRGTNIFAISLKYYGRANYDSVAMPANSKLWSTKYSPLKYSNSEFLKVGGYYCDFLFPSPFTRIIIMSYLCYFCLHKIL